MRGLSGARALRRIALLPALLIGVDFLDELWSGVPAVGSPGIQAAFGLTYAELSLVLFVVPETLSFLVEPALFILSDRLGRKRFIVGGLAVLAMANFAAGLTENVWLFATAIAITFPASGCGVQLAQAALMDADPQRREQLMTRWTLAGSLGDLAAPVLFAAFALIAWGWREAFVLMGGLLLGYAVVLASRRFPDVVGREADEPAPTLRESVRAALSNRRLLAWLLGVWLCSLLDEIVVVFGSLYLRDLGADQASRGLLLAAGSAGAVLGLVLADRWLARTDPLRLLALACAVCIALYLGWIAIPLAPLGPLLFFGVGVSSAPLYPIAMAQAYRQLPGQAGMVNALGHFFFPLTLAAPFVLGFVADAVGLVPTLLLLVAQPAGLLWLALRGQTRAADTPVASD